MTDTAQSGQLRQRILLGLAAWAARLIPVPLLDDFLHEKAFHLLVSRAIKAHGRGYRSRNIAPLYAGNQGCLTGCLRWVVILPVKVVIFPIRKIVAWVMAARWLARDLAEAVLLGRALDRCLASGRLAEEADPEARRDEAALIRRAFDETVAGTDLRLLRDALVEGLRAARGLPRTGLRVLRTVLGSEAGDAGDPMEDLSSADQARLRSGTDKVEAVLHTPRVQALLEKFDICFDEALVSPRAPDNP